MTILPLTLAMIALSQNPASTTSPADFNNDGVVDITDLITLTSNIGTACEGDCQTDLNNDGVTDQQDILVLMQMWGAVAGWVNSNTSETIETSSTSETTTPCQDHDLSWQGQGPVLYDAIYYDHLARSSQRNALAEELNQGEFTKSWCGENNVAVQSMVYNGGVDWYEDGAYDDSDKEKFTAWLDANVPLDYDGPICLDLEGQWWEMWHTESQEVMDTIIDFYIEGLEFAKAKRPNAKIGYWGLPRRRHTSPNYTTASVERLLHASTGLFPDVYEWNPGQDDTAWIKRHVTNTIAMVEGEVPVFVQTCPRYKATSHAMKLHTVEEFIHDQVHGSLAAVWTDANGQDHRIAGISMWDAYLYCWQGSANWSSLNNDERKETFNELDTYHKTALACMKSCVDAAVNAAQSQLAEEESSSNASAIAQAAAEEAARVAAAQEEASRLRADRKRQRSRLVRRLNSERTKIRRASSNYRKEAKQYRSARSSFKNKRGSFKGSRNAYRSALKDWRTSGRKQARGSKSRSSAWKKFATARNQYRSSRSSWRTNVKSWRASVKNFKQQRSSYRTSRNAWRSTVKTWRTANATWRQMARAASTLAAVGK